MKKLVIIALTFVTVQAFAQEQENMKPENGERTERAEFSPEQIANLETKRMTLQLDLTEAQQEEVRALFLKNAEERQAFVKERLQRKKENKVVQLTKEERYAKMNERLDRKIVEKQNLKRILTEEQFEKWEKNRLSKRGKRGFKKDCKKTCEGKAYKKEK